MASEGKQMDEEEWLYSSMKIYNHLFMYELQNSTECLTWISENEICVACVGNQQSEILALQLPDKLGKRGGDKGLQKNRDFHLLCGGFHNAEIKEMVHVPNTRTIVTSDLGNVIVWQLENSRSGELDIVKQTKVLHTQESNKGICKLAVRPGQGHLLHGCDLDSLQVTDLHDGKTIYSVQGQGEGVVGSLAQIGWLDECTFLACTVKGDLFLGSLEEKTINLRKISVSHSTAAFALSPRGLSREILLLSKSSQLTKMVLNKPEVIDSFHLGLGTAPDEQNIILQVSPDEPQVISVSGFDDKVHIFDTSPAGNKNIKPIFSHAGHGVLSEDSNLFIRTQHWHPRGERLLLSSASDGSLHAWSYVLKS